MEQNRLDSLANSRNNNSWHGIDLGVFDKMKKIKYIGRLIVAIINAVYFVIWLIVLVVCGFIGLIIDSAKETTIGATSIEVTTI